MDIVILCHSIVSGWNHGNAHFLRGIGQELVARGHSVRFLEPREGWSRSRLVQYEGQAYIDAFRHRFPDLVSQTYDPATLRPEEALAGADLVLVHEWTEPDVVARIGEHHRRNGDYTLLFHDTHHRSVTAPEEMEAYDLSGYDGVLAFGRAIREAYLDRGWAHDAWTWHEAADARTFTPQPTPSADPRGDVVWIGNWGDDERTDELHEFLLDPVRDLGLGGTVHGVRYPDEGLQAVQEAGLDYGGWLPNFRVPEVFARHQVTLHVPRGPYVEALPGIPTIRVFEALACGIPLICAPWEDAENLFTPGQDYLVAHDGEEMRAHLRAVLEDPDLGRRLAEHGRRTVLDHHTCAHRVDELLDIVDRIEGGQRLAPAPVAATAGGASDPEPTDGAPRNAAPSRSPVPETGPGPRKQMPLRGPQAARASPGPDPEGDPRSLEIAFFGSSLVSSYWNGAATYYRGMLRALHERGHRTTFYEPDAYDRQAHRDIDDPPYAEVVVYDNDESAARRALDDARGADVVVKASGVGVFDDLLAREVLDLRDERTRVVYWDVDAAATLDELHKKGHHPLHDLLPRYDAVLTYGGGPPVVDAYEALGARRCVPIYNALDPDTHHPVDPDPRFQVDLAFMGNRLPDREARVEEFFLDVAEALPDGSFLLGGNGWDDKPLPDNVQTLGHVPTGDHNAFNSTPQAVLNINRESMARYGYSPATRVFEAAGAGACLITDAFDGIERFLEPGREVLVAHDTEDVVEHLRSLTPERARSIGERARARMLEEHTYHHRARRVSQVLGELLDRPLQEVSSE